MIDRYSSTEMKQIWSLQNKFQKWLEIELAACDVHRELGNLPQSDFDIICKNARFDVDRINAIEADIQHDVIAFLTNLAENIGPSSRYVHLGLTSSDVVDTAFSMLIQDAGKVILQGLETLIEAVKIKAYEHKLTPCMGRTHGVHAEPTTFGLKLTIWYDELKRNKARLIEALETTNVGKISGAVGNYAHMPPHVEEKVCQKLGLNVAKASTQILQRDRHAHFITTLAIIGGTLEKMAVEIRGLQKTETNEVQEPFSSKQKGSSAMPHKRNPILCERITGLSRAMRGYAITALENQALWHERDISHSSAERMIFPDATATLDYMLSLSIKVIQGMLVNEAQMKENIGKSFDVYYSQQLLLKLIDKGILREDAYRIVQRNALTAFDERVSFETKIRSDENVTKFLSSAELSGIFDFGKYTAHVETIFNRVYSS